MLVATGGAAWLPKSGPWLVSVKNAIGVLLLGLAIGLLSRVLPGPVTLLLMVGALGLALAIGIAAGTIMATWVGRWSDHQDRHLVLIVLGAAQREQLRGLNIPTYTAEPASLDQLADQVDLVGTGLLTNLLDLRQQLLTAHLAGIQRCNLHGKYLRPTRPQRRDDAVPVGKKPQTHKTEHAGHQYQGVTRG